CRKCRLVDCVEFSFPCSNTGDGHLYFYAGKKPAASDVYVFCRHFAERHLIRVCIPERIHASHHSMVRRNHSVNLLFRNIKRRFFESFNTRDALVANRCPAWLYCAIFCGNDYKIQKAIAVTLLSEGRKKMTNPIHPSNIEKGSICQSHIR